MVKNDILPHLRVQLLPKHVPRVLQKKAETKPVYIHPLPLLVFLLPDLPSAPPWTEPAGYLCRARQLLARQALLSDTATLTELNHVTRLLAEHLT